MEEEDHQVVGSDVVAKLASLQTLGQSLRSPIELPQIVVLGSQSSALWPVSQSSKRASRSLEETQKNSFNRGSRL